MKLHDPAAIRVPHFQNQRPPGASLRAQRGSPLETCVVLRQCHGKLSVDSPIPWFSVAELHVGDTSAASWWLVAADIQCRSPQAVLLQVDCFTSSEIDRANDRSCLPNALFCIQCSAAGLDG